MKFVMEMLKYKFQRLLVKIYTEKQWLMYKFFGTKSKNPCGRHDAYNYLCCLQPAKANRVYFSEDKKECYCKVCDSIRIMANHPLNEKDPWGW